MWTVAYIYLILLVFIISSISSFKKSKIFLVYLQEVDIVAAPISIQAERDPAMDFSYPYYYEYTTVLVKKPDVNSIKWRTLIDPFKFEVLLTIGNILLLNL
jgi:hypothetical protein